MTMTYNQLKEGDKIKFLSGFVFCNKEEITNVENGCRVGGIVVKGVTIDHVFNDEKKCKKIWDFIAKSGFEKDGQFYVPENTVIRIGRIFPGNGCDVYLNDDLMIIMCQWNFKFSKDQIEYEDEDLLVELVK